MTTTVPGIDVSQHQGVIDWPAVAAAGIRFAFVRALEGQTPDPTFERNRRGALEAGLLVGAYQYLRARHPGRYQADLLLEQLGDLGPGELPPAVDVEELDGQDAVAVRACVHAWVERTSMLLGWTISGSQGSRTTRPASISAVMSRSLSSTGEE